MLRQLHHSQRVCMLLEVSGQQCFLWGALPVVALDPNQGADPTRLRHLCSVRDGGCDRAERRPAGSSGLGAGLCAGVPRTGGDRRAAAVPLHRGAAPHRVGPRKVRLAPFLASLSRWQRCHIDSGGFVAGMHIR